MKEETGEEILIRISEVLRRRFILHPKMTASETVERIEQIIIEEKEKEDSQECSNVTDAENSSPKMKPTQG